MIFLLPITTICTLLFECFSSSHSGFLFASAGPFGSVQVNMLYSSLSPPQVLRAVPDIMDSQHFLLSE
jgi:hypothetical protein